MTSKEPDETNKETGEETEKGDSHTQDTVNSSDLEEIVEGNWLMNEWIKPVVIPGVILFVFVSTVLYINDSSIFCFTGDHAEVYRDLREGNYTCMICEYGNMTPEQITGSNEICNKAIALNVTLQNDKTVAKVEGNWIRDVVMYKIGEIITIGALA